MSPFLFRTGLSTLAALAAVSVHAQVATAPTAPVAPRSASKPATTQTMQQPPAPMPYRSVFEGYQAFTDAKPLDWKDANATVETIGGWRTYAKEAPEPATNAAVPPASPPADPHAGHGNH